MASEEGCCSDVASCFFDYGTSITLVIRSKTVGVIYRLIQFIIVTYVALYVCWMKKAYQETDSLISSVTTKVKGTAVSNRSISGVHVWDVAEYVIPPQGESSFFVMTNVIITPNQTQSTCPEVPTPSTICTSNKACKKGRMDVRGNGVQTGLCVKYSNTVKTCEVLAWCPLEDDSKTPQPALLGAAKHFTVLIKNNIKYPNFNFHKRNIQSNVNATYLKRCVFNRKTDPDCPIFRLGDVVSEAGEDFQSLAIQGGVIGILIDWPCNLDLPETMCVPKYSFQRLDSRDPSNNIALGYNFRFAKFFKDKDNKESRTLMKGYGIRFDVIVFGQAGKCSLPMTFIILGATLACLRLAGAICDWFMLTFLERRDQYAKNKFVQLDNKDDGMGETLSIGPSYGTH